MPRKLYRCLTCLVAGSLLAITACRPGPREEALPESGATLEGTITFDGKQVPFAMITVQGDGAKPPATGKVQNDGRYKVQNVPLGQVTIGINTDAARGDYQSRVMAASYQGPEKAGRKRAKLPPFVSVPKKYNAPESSGITTEIQEGANQFDIKLP